MPTAESLQSFFLQWHTAFMDADRIPVILLALGLVTIVGMILGPLLGNANPLSWRLFDIIFGRFGERMDRAHRTYTDLSFRGLMLTILVIALAAAAGKACVVLLMNQQLLGATTIILLSIFLTAGSVWFILLKLYTTMETGKSAAGGYLAIARSARVNLAGADDYAPARAALGFAAVSFDKGLVAPSLWYMIGGFPMLCVYAALSFMVWRFGKKGFTKGFASVPLALEKLMGFIPSIIAALLITLAAAFTPTARVHRGVLSWLGQKDRAPYEQGGFPLSALAWSLNVSLGGASQDLSGSAIKGAWVGPKNATAKIDHTHIRRAIYISIIAHLLYVAALLGAYMWSHILGV